VLWISNRAFSIAAPCAWNGLPIDEKLLRSTDSFSRKLRTFLFESVFGHQGTCWLHFAWGIAEAKCMVATAVLVCLSVPRHIPTLLHGPICNLGNGSGCPLVVHCWADLQLVHRCHCCDNIHVCKLIALYTASAYSSECRVSASVCTRSMPGLFCDAPSVC